MVHYFIVEGGFVMELLDGLALKKQILESLKEQVGKLKCQLKLAVIQVGDDPASKVYIRQKVNMMSAIDSLCECYHFATDASEEMILDLIDALNADPTMDGILVQMPLPKGFDAHRIQNRIDPLKDVDGLTDINAGKLVHGREGLAPCTPLGVMRLLDHYQIPVEGKNVVIVGRSDLVGKPLASMMTNRNATVTLCHSKTQNLASVTKGADILVAAVGKPKFFGKEYVREGATFIDVGISRVDGKLCGDFDFDAVCDMASYITPVPGGVGPMTVAELGENTLKAHQLRKKLK